MRSLRELKAVIPSRFLPMADLTKCLITTIPLTAFCYRSMIHLNSYNFWLKTESFICSGCETTTRKFTDTLKQAGANGVIGFTQKPQWHYQAVKGLWRDFDLGILQRLLYRQNLTSIQTHKDAYIDMIDGVINYVDEHKAEDYLAMKNVLSSMMITD